MPIPQKVLSHLLVAVFALGSAGCPCPAAASDEAGSQGHHGSHQSSPAATTGGCQHLECVTDCGRIVAQSSQQHAGLICAGKFQLDDYDAIEPDPIARSHRQLPVAWTGPPPRRSWLSHDTPVRRFDRLLD